MILYGLLTLITLTRKFRVPDGPEIHFFYQTDTLEETGNSFRNIRSRHFSTFKRTFGKYPYSKYSVIQGGDWWHGISHGDSNHGTQVNSEVWWGDCP